MSGDVAISVGDRPFEFLVVGLTLHITDHCHVRLGDHEIGSSVEAEVLENRCELLGVGDLCKECWVAVSVDGSKLLVQLDCVLKFRIKLPILLHNDTRRMSSCWQ